MNRVNEIVRAPCWRLLVLIFFVAGCEIGTEPVPQSAPSSGATAGATAQPEFTAPTPGSPRVARGNLTFIEGYQQGIDYGLREGKPMLVFFTAEWCHYCHQMANEAFTNEKVVSLSQRFTCILVDADAEPDVCRQFRVRGYPTIQFLSPRGVPLNKIEGKKPGHNVLMEMQTALQTVARRSEPAVEATTR